MAEFDLTKFSSLTPEQFSQLVKSTPDDKMKTVIQGDARGPVLDEIFARFPTLFRADQAGSTNTVIHWIITGRPDGGADTYEIVIADGVCVVSETPRHEPKLAITIAPLDFLKVVAGIANPVMMFMTGKLKAKGDLALAASIGKLFDIPKA